MMLQAPRSDRCSQLDFMSTGRCLELTPAPFIQKGIHHENMLVDVLFCCVQMKVYGEQNFWKTSALGGKFVYAPKVWKYSIQ